MTGLLGIGIGVMIVADAVVGVRLVLLSLRTRCLPELAIGSSLLLLGGIGYPLSIAARNGMGGPELSDDLLGAAFAIQNLGAFAMAVATWRTFRPEAAWARALCAVVPAVLVASWLVMHARGEFAWDGRVSGWYWIGFAARSLPYLWTAAESWHYFGKLRRRLALGLAEPEVTDRFRLWAISATGIAAAFALFAAAVATGVEVSTSPWVLATTSLVGCVSGVSFWLAFLPPRWYLGRFAAAATAPSPSPSF